MASLPKCEKPKDASLDETLAPHAHGGLGKLQALTDRTICFALGAAQDIA